MMTVSSRSCSLLPARNDIAAILRRMQPRWQRYRGDSLRLRSRRTNCCASALRSAADRPWSACGKRPVPASSARGCCRLTVVVKARARGGRGRGASSARRLQAPAPAARPSRGNARGSAAAAAAAAAVLTVVAAHAGGFVRRGVRSHRQHVVLREHLVADQPPRLAHIQLLRPVVVPGQGTPLAELGGCEDAER